MKLAPGPMRFWERITCGNLGGFLEEGRFELKLGKSREMGQAEENEDRAGFQVRKG